MAHRRWRGTACFVVREVQDVRPPAVSKDRHDVLIQFAMKGDPNIAANRVQVGERVMKCRSLPTPRAARGRSPHVPPEWR